MITIQELKSLMELDPENWFIPFMDFVDDIRRYKDLSSLEPFELTNNRFDALIASTIEYLGDELNLEIPDWIWHVPACKDPMVCIWY